MEIKLIALDLDGTALRSDNTLSPKVAKAIEAAADGGEWRRVATFTNSQITPATGPRQKPQNITGSSLRSIL